MVVFLMILLLHFLAPLYLLRFFTDSMLYECGLVAFGRYLFLCISMYIDEVIVVN